MGQTFQVLLIENSELLSCLRPPWYNRSLGKCYTNSCNGCCSFSNPSNTSVPIFVCSCGTSSHSLPCIS